MMMALEAEARRTSASVMFPVAAWTILILTFSVPRGGDTRGGVPHDREGIAGDGDLPKAHDLDGHGRPGALEDLAVLVEHGPDLAHGQAGGERLPLEGGDLRGVPRGGGPALA